MEPPKEVRTGCGIWWMAGMAARRDPLQPREAASTRRVSGATVKACGVAVDSACRGKAGRLSRRTVCGERGNRFWSAYLPASRVGGGEARGLLMGQERDGGSVVVRGRESRLHGEGTQRVCDVGTGMPGGHR